MNDKAIRVSVIMGIEYEFSRFAPSVGDLTEHEGKIWKCIGYNIDSTGETFELRHKNISRTIHYSIGEYCYLEKVLKVRPLN